MPHLHPALGGTPYSHGGGYDAVDAITDAKARILAGDAYYDRLCAVEHRAVMSDSGLADRMTGERAAYEDEAIAEQIDCWEMTGMRPVSNGDSWLGYSDDELAEMEARP